jgi:hypothetical protein
MNLYQKRPGIVRPFFARDLLYKAPNWLRRRLFL